MYMPMHRHGTNDPTGPLVRVAPLSRKTATRASHGRFGIPYMAYMPPTMHAVSSMSTRQATAARKTSNIVAHTSIVIHAIVVPLWRRTMAKVAVSIAEAARADGRRDRNSVTTPPLSNADSTAMHQANSGGL